MNDISVPIYDSFVIMNRFLRLIAIKRLNTIHGKSQCHKLVCVLACKQDTFTAEVNKSCVKRWCLRLTNRMARTWSAETSNSHTRATVTEALHNLADKLQHLKGIPHPVSKGTTETVGLPLNAATHMLTLEYHNPNIQCCDNLKIRIRSHRFH